MGARLIERVRTAINTIRDAEQASLLLRGPLPLWMQDAYEREAVWQGQPVGHVIFEVLAVHARQFQEMMENMETRNKGEMSSEA